MSQPLAYPSRIKKIKQRRLELGWSMQTVTDKIIELGLYVSFSTVKRVFAEGSEDKKFKHETLAAIEAALGLAGAKPIAPADEEFYRGWLKDLNEQLKKSAKLHVVKNLAIIFLVAYNFVKLVLDRSMPDIGWWTPENPNGWIVSATVFALFCLVTLCYIIYWKKTEAKDKEHDL